MDDETALDDEGALVGAIAALTTYFVGDASMLETLERVAELARDAVRVASDVGITLVADGTPGTYAFTDPDVSEVDQAQYRTGDGPCLKAYDIGEIVVVKSTRTSSEHAGFCAAAAAHDILSVMALPLSVPDGRIGAMNFYSTVEGAFGDAEIEVGQRFAAQASFLLVNAQAYWDARSLGENLAEAMRSRAGIEQAKGIIMARTGADEAAAFELLRAQSQSENRKLREVADEIVRHTAHQKRRELDSSV